MSNDWLGTTQTLPRSLGHPALFQHPGVIRASCWPSADTTGMPLYSSKRDTGMFSPDTAVFYISRMSEIQLIKESIITCKCISERIVISRFVWEMRTRESDRDRLSCENCIVHSWFVWMLWTREEPSLTDSAGIRDLRMRMRDGGRSWVLTTQWTIHRYRKHDWTNERTNKRLFLANWTTRTDSRKRIMKSITNKQSR